MKPARLLFALPLLATAGGAEAQAVIVSPAPERVAVTVYRDPRRPPNEAPRLDWLDGFAFITETRTVTIPAGETDLRFEGVAGGILPQSAIVSGLPDGVVERNRDALLLSPAGLVARTLGRRVHIRRTSRATGAVSEQEAIVRSDATGALVLQTAEGFEALRCSGLAETPIYGEVPAGLSARPTLSVRTRAAAPVTATVTLSYLASGFDWQANYIARLSPDATRLDLFAWLTLASGDETSFRDAETQAVAGRVNHERVDPGGGEGGALQLRCWPQGRTHEIPTTLNGQRIRRGSDVVVDSISAEDVSNLPAAFVVTGLRASQEELADLKLYRIPEPVTVAAHSQKQVAFLERPGVRVGIVYRQRFSAGYVDQGPDRARRLLVTRNRPEEGLGLPLPAGAVQLYGEAAGRPILLGEGYVPDRAVGEDVEIDTGEMASVLSRNTSPTKHDDYLLTVTNDRAEPVSYEAEFYVEPGRRFRPGTRLRRRNGLWLWAATIPANGSATLRYRVAGTGGD